MAKKDWTYFAGCLSLSGSILENVRVYNDQVGEDKVQKAISIVQLDEFIRKLPEGINAELAERGQNISQGEKQLISFARALAFAAEIIIMDEATASIDPQTEAKIQRSMEKLLAGKTALIVAHRLTSVLDADEILYFSNGRITAGVNIKICYRNLLNIKSWWNCKC